MKKTTLGLVVGVLVIVGIVVYVYSDKKQASAPSPTPVSTLPTPASNDASSSVWFGTLKATDNKDKGNLMLVQKSGPVVYIRTSRDFSALIDKDVAVTVDGTPASFTLIDIQATQ